MNLGYTINIPDAPNDPSNDQPDMKTNTNSISSIIQIDHAGFNDNNGGYHTVIHQVKQVADPLNIANYNEIYAKDYTPDTTGGVAETQLFVQSGSGIISQLTGFLTDAVDAADGWQWIGGILVQWGSVSFAGGSDHESSTVTFKDRVAGAIPFPNNIYIINATLQVASQAETTASNTIAIRSFSKTVFRWVFNSSSSTGSTRYPGFYWIAIGS